MPLKAAKQFPLFERDGGSEMSTHLKPWVGTLGWGALMLIVWTLFVPGNLSTTTFVMLAATGLVLALIFASMFGINRKRERPVNDILFESGGASAPPRS
jgi:hypothetical protein